MPIAGRHDPSAQPVASRGSAEERFVAFARSRDPALLEGLLREHASQAFAHAHRLLGNRAAAEDAVQEACVRLIASADRYRGDVPFAAWLGRLVSSAAIDEHRRELSQKRRVADAARRSPAIEQGEEPDAVQLDRLREALAALPESYRAPLALRYFGGLDHAAIAQALGLREGTVAVRLTRGIERLRARLTRGGGVASIAALEALRAAPAHAAPTTLLASLSHLARTPPTAIALGAGAKAAAIACALLVAVGGGLVAQRARQRPPPAPAAKVADTAASTAVAGVVAANRWTPARPHGIPVSCLDAEPLVWVPGVGAVKFDRYHQRHAGALVAYDFTANRWDLLDVGAFWHDEDFPDAGVSPFLAFAPRRRALIAVGGAGGSQQVEARLRVWSIDPRTGAGHDLHATPEPGPAWAQIEAAAAFDEAHETLVLVGPAGTWTCSLADRRWRLSAARGTPPPERLFLPMLAYRARDRRVWLFGGRTAYGPGATYHDDCYAYDVPTETWSRVAIDGRRPAARQKAGFAYDARDDVFLLYGGHNDSGLDAPPAPLDDTWILDPEARAWTRLAPERSPPPGEPFGRLAYDAEHDVFVLGVRGADGCADGPSAALGMQTWLFRWRGDGPRPGSVASAPTPIAGGLNRRIDGWAMEPTIAADAAGVARVAWIEAGAPFDAGRNGAFHLASVRLGGRGAEEASAGLDDGGADVRVRHEPSLAVVAGTPWLAWDRTSSAGGLPEIEIGRWDGARWRAVPLGVDAAAAAPLLRVRPQLADVAGIPHLAWLESDPAQLRRARARVSAYDGARWRALGDAPLDRDDATAAASLSRAGSVAIAGDAAGLYAAWTADRVDASETQATPSQVYAARWDGSAWRALGGTLDVDGSAAAEDAAIALVGGRPAVAWSEYAGTGAARLYVKVLGDAGWILAGGGAVDRDPGGLALRPSLVAAGDELFVGWVEQERSGASALARVAAWRGGAWRPLGDALNADPEHGTAQRLVLAVAQGRPVAAWGERRARAMQQILARRWNGSAWEPLR